MLSAAEECREPSWKFQGISHCLESGHPDCHAWDLAMYCTLHSTNKPKSLKSLYIVHELKGPWHNDVNKSSKRCYWR